MIYDPVDVRTSVSNKRQVWWGGGGGGKMPIKIVKQREIILEKAIHGYVERTHVN